MGAQTTVVTIMIINRDENVPIADRIIGSDFYVGDNSIAMNNTPCGANPQGSGVYSCGGKVGQYLGLVKSNYDFINICQIRAYSYAANSYTNFQYLTSGIVNCP